MIRRARPSDGSGRKGLSCLSQLLEFASFLIVDAELLSYGRILFSYLCKSTLHQLSFDMSILSCVQIILDYPLRKHSW